jgi:hypothetical protein
MADGISQEVQNRQEAERPHSDTLVIEPRRLKFLDSLMVLLAVMALVCAIAHPKESSKSVSPQIAAGTTNPAQNFLPDPQRQFSQIILPHERSN